MIPRVKNHLLRPRLGEALGARSSTGTAGAQALGDPPAWPSKGLLASAVGSTWGLRAGGTPGWCWQPYAYSMVVPSLPPLPPLCVAWLGLLWCFSTCTEMMPLLDGCVGRKCQGRRKWSGSFLGHQWKQEGDVFLGLGNSVSCLFLSLLWSQEGLDITVTGVAGVTLTDSAVL